MIWLDKVEREVFFLISVKFKKVTPNSLKLKSTSGFGYSFSNAAHNAEKENGVPYVAVGAVNITEDNSEDATAVLLTSALICIGIKPECKSEGLLSNKILKPFREMNGTSPGIGIDMYLLKNKKDIDP